MAQSVWNQYPNVLPDDGERVLVKYSHSDEATNTQGDPVIGIFQYDAKEDTFKNADGKALEKNVINAWVPL